MMGIIDKCWVRGDATLCIFFNDPSNIHSDLLCRKCCNVGVALVFVGILLKSVVFQLPGFKSFLIYFFFQLVKKSSQYSWRNTYLCSLHPHIWRMTNVIGLVHSAVCEAECSLRFVLVLILQNLIFMRSTGLRSSLSNALPHCLPICLFREQEPKAPVKIS